MGFEKGNKLGQGRPPKVEEEKTNYFILKAIKEIKSVTTDEEARIEVIKDLLLFDRGKIFVAEHLLGKPKETIQTTHNLNNFDIKDLFKFDTNKG
jgi:hypothetical protein